MHAGASWRVARTHPVRLSEVGDWRTGGAMALLVAALVISWVTGPAAALALGVVVVVAVVLVRFLPEAFLALLMVSGPLSSTSLAGVVPVGLTTIALSGTLAAIAVLGWRRRDLPFRLPRAVIPFGLLVALLFGAGFHSPDPGGALDKAFTFATITTAAFLAPLFIIDGRRSLMRFAALVALTGMLVGIFAVNTGHDSHPLTLPGSDSEIVVGQYAGLGLIAVLTILWPLTPGVWRAVWIVPAALAAPALVGAGSRGALLGTVLAIVSAVPFLLARRETRLSTLAVLITLAVAAPTIWATSPPAAQEKYLATIRVDQASQALDAGGGQRQEILDAAVRLFEANPLGVGTDGYPALTGFEWPHNIILELGAEVGIIGIALFLAIVAGVARPLVHAIRAGRTEAIGAGALAVSTLVLALSSFDLNNNRAMWLMLGVALATASASRAIVPSLARPVIAPRSAQRGPIATVAPPVRAQPTERLPRRRKRSTPVAPVLPRATSSTAAGGVESLAFRGAEAFLGVMLVVLTARFMEPDGRGLFALASLCALLCALPLGSVWSASAIEIAHDRVPLPRLNGALLLIAVAGGSVIALIALGTIPFIDQPWWIVAFPAVLTPLLLVARYQEGVFQSLGDVRAVNLMHLARAGLPVALMAAPLVLGASDQTTIAVWAASLSVLPLLFIVPALRRTGGIARPADRALLGRLLRGGAQLLVANTAVLLSTRLGLLFLAVLATTAAVGVYSVAIAAAEVVYLASFALMSTTFRTIGSGRGEESLRVTTRALRHAVLLHVVGCALLVPVLWVALPVVVGPGYDDVPWLLVLMAPGLIGQAGFWVLHTYFTVQLARPALIVRVASTALAANVVAAAVLVPLFGIWGAALASSAANLASAVVMIAVFLRVSGARGSALLPGTAEMRDYRQLLQGLGARRLARATDGRERA
jgi:O-antigen/teichoic acid export membrane protein/O-antigen ligase